MQKNWNKWQGYTFYSLLAKMVGSRAFVQLKQFELSPEISGCFFKKV